MSEIELVFDNAKTVERKTGSKTTYALKTDDDHPVKVRLTLEAKDPKILDEIVKKVLDASVTMKLTNQ